MIFGELFFFIIKAKYVDRNVIRVENTKMKKVNNKLNYWETSQPLLMPW